MRRRPEIRLPPRHRAPTAQRLDPAAVTADDRLLNEIGKGGYAGSDPLGQLLGVYRRQVLQGEGAPGGGLVGRMNELVRILAGCSLIASLVAVAVVLAASAPVGITMLVMSMSWSAIALGILCSLRPPR